MNRPPSPDELRRLATARYSAQYIISQRDALGEHLSTWHTEQKTLDLLTDGRFVEVYGAQDVAQKKETYLQVQNLVNDALLDATRLSASAVPALTCEAIGKGLAAADASELHAAIGKGYREYNHDGERAERFFLDIFSSGAAFQVHIADGTAPYPKHKRLDPRGCLPNFFEEELLDLIYQKYIPLNQAKAMFPELDPEFGGWDWEMTRFESDQVEVIDYFTDDFVVRTLRATASPATQKGSTRELGYIYTAWKNTTDCIPVSYALLDSPSGKLRGLFNQSGSVVNTMNRLVTLMLDNAARATYSELVVQGSLDETVQTGPDAQIHLDPQVPNAQAFRLGPAQLQGGLFNLMSLMETGARGGVAFPQQRGGEIPGSIYSGSAIAASMGQQSQMVQSAQRAKAAMDRRSCEIDFELDRMMLPGVKALLAPAGNKKVYDTEKDIPADYLVKVSYGMVSGLDPLNAVVQGQGLASTDVISYETLRAMVPGVENPSKERDLIYNKKAMDFLFQRVAGSVSPESGIALAESIQKGIPLLEGLRLALQAEAAAQQAQMQAQMQQAGPGQLGPGAGATEPAGEPGDVQKMNLALIQGGRAGTSPNVPVPPAFAPPPFSQVSVRPT